jgi:DNA-binding MarR family transcriptional regulator
MVEAVDGRSQALTLTPAGRDLHDRARSAADAHEARMFSGFRRRTGGDAGEIAGGLGAGAP